GQELELVLRDIAALEIEHAQRLAPCTQRDGNAAPPRPAARGEVGLKQQALLFGVEGGLEATVIEAANTSTHPEIRETLGAGHHDGLIRRRLHARGDHGDECMLAPEQARELRENIVEEITQR